MCDPFLDRSNYPIRRKKIYLRHADVTAARVLAEQLRPISLLVNIGHLVLDSAATQVQQTRWRPGGNVAVHIDSKISSDRLVQLEDLLGLEEIVAEAGGEVGGIGISRGLLRQAGVSRRRLLHRGLLGPVAWRLVGRHLLSLRIVHRVRRVGDRQGIVLRLVMLMVVLVVMLILVIVVGSLVSSLVGGVASLHATADALERGARAGVAWK